VTQLVGRNVTLPSGAVIYNPMRVAPDGDGCEVVFRLRRLISRERPHAAIVIRRSRRPRLRTRPSQSACRFAVFVALKPIQGAATATPAAVPVVLGWR
jgi:hypothetical protein